MKALAALALLLLTACAAPTLLVEAEHVSHPTAGWPFSHQVTTEQDSNGAIYHGRAENDLNQVSALLRWRRDDWYLDAGAGVNVLGRSGGGFHGPALTGTVRFGREFRLWGPK